MAKILIAAITVAVLDPAKKGELKYIAPGSPFTVKDDDEAKTLVERGHASYADASDAPAKADAEKAQGPVDA